MTKENFSAWELDPAAFDRLTPAERLDFLVGYAVLAPSGHNSQPWKFVIDGNAIVALPDMSRALPISDKNERQQYLSLGCAIENLCQAADYYGYRVVATMVDAEGKRGCRLQLDGSPLQAAARKSDHAALAIPRRRTNRNAYEARLPEADFLTWLRGRANERLQLHLVSQEPLKASVAAVVSDALIEAMDDDGFRHELSGYIRPNITNSKTGMPMYGFGMPTPPSFLAPWLVKKFNVNRPSRKKDEALLNVHTPMFVVITTRSDGPDAWIEAGRAYERIALEAERRSIATAPMAAAIQIGDNHKRLQQLLATPDRAQVFFRIGYAKGMTKHTPRIPAEELVAKV